MESKWYAVYVHGRHEKKVAEWFSVHQIDHYLPLQKVRRQWSDRIKTVEEPLFKSYVFVNVTDQEKESVRNTPGVVNFVYWLGKPAIIRSDEIDGIRAFVKNYENITVIQEPPTVDSIIRVTGGPFVNQTAKVIQVEKNKVKLYLESMGCYLIADITKNKMLNLRPNA